MKTLHAPGHFSGWVIKGNQCCNEHQLMNTKNFILDTLKQDMRSNFHCFTDIVLTIAVMCKELNHS